MSPITITDQYDLILMFAPPPHVTIRCHKGKGTTIAQEFLGYDLRYDPLPENI